MGMHRRENRRRSRQEVRKRYTAPTKKPHRLWHFFKICLLMIFLVGIAGLGLFAFYAKSAPTITQAKLQSGGTSSLYTNNGKFLLSLGSEKRIYITNRKIPQKLKNAVVSVEDRHFYQDKLGIDPARILESLVTNARTNSIAAGGSTITQQLVKLTVFSTAASQRTLKRKAQEAWLAMKVQREFSKNQILEFYINKVYMNYGNYGMATAANYYYGKSLKQLDLAQTALLAGMPNAPVAYDPYIYPRQAAYRRNIVLKAMLENKKITHTQYNQAINENIQKGLKPQKANNESYLRKIDDPYIKEVIAEVKQKGFDPYNDKLKITINLNQKAQTHLYHLANNNSVPFTNNKMQIGSTVVKPTNGHVIAILGGRHLPAVQLGLDRAVQTDRSTGSSIKPILDYGPAIQYLNWSTAHILYDTKYVYPGTNIQLYDWDNRYQGAMTMRYALKQSRNVPAVKTLAKVGMNRATLFARRMGINVPINSGLSTAIGANASSLQMAGAYSSFATEGIYHKPQFVSKIQTPDGQTRKYNSAGVRVMKKSTAYIMTDMLKDVIKSGSGTKAKINGLYQAGKTGTVKYSNQELAHFPTYSPTPKDSWFVGYTKRYVISTWTGYDNLKDGTISGIGQNSAMLFYKQMMAYLMQNQPNTDWTKPNSVVRARIVKNSNPPRLATSGGIWQLFVKGHTPSGIVDQSASYDAADERTDTNKGSTNKHQVNNFNTSKTSENGSSHQSNQAEQNSSSSQTNSNKTKSNSQNTNNNNTDKTAKGNHSSTSTTTNSNNNQTENNQHQQQNDSDSNAKNHQNQGQ